MFETVILRKEEHIATITLNRPDEQNTLNDKLLRELMEALSDVAEDDDTRVLIITGAGKYFCAGGDVREFVGAKGEAYHARVAAGEIGGQIEQERWQIFRMFLLTQEMNKPTIAMVNGAAAGGGFDLALACDMRIGSEKARFKVSLTTIGLAVAGGIAWFLPRIVGLPKAAELIFTGDIIDAAEAERIGILNRIVPSAELEEETLKLARKIADGPPIAIRMDKMLLYKCLEVDLETALKFSEPCERLTFLTKDHQEAVAAFREKRKPVFRGR